MGRRKRNVIQSTVDFKWSFHETCLRRKKSQNLLPFPRDFINHQILNFPRSQMRPIMDSFETLFHEAKTVGFHTMTSKRTFVFFPSIRFALMFPRAKNSLATVLLRPSVDSFSPIIAFFYETNPRAVPMCFGLTGSVYRASVPTAKVSQ